MRTLTHHTMLRNTLLATVALVAIVLVVGTQARTANRASLTFSGEVALPGVVLPAGTYLFEVANPDSSQDTVLVRSKNGRVQYMGITLQAVRPTPVSDKELVKLGESAAGSPAPILAWFPAGQSIGHEFIYR